MAETLPECGHPAAARLTSPVTEETACALCVQDVLAAHRRRVLALEIALREMLGEFEDDGTDHWWCNGCVPGGHVRDWRSVLEEREPR